MTSVATYYDGAVANEVSDPVRKTVHRHALAALAFTVLSFWIVEFAIIVKKYHIFKLGFLQPYVLSSWPERMEYVITSLLLTSAVFGVVWALWFAVAKRLKVRSIFSAYNFVWVVGGIGLGALAVRYQLLQYFSDALTFRIIKDLGGGVFTDAIKYVMDEIAIVAYVLVGVIVTYFIGYTILRRRFASAMTYSVGVLSTKWTLAVSGSAVLLASVMIVTTNSDSKQYFLSNSIAFIAANESLVALTDFDGDHYGALGSPRDLNPFDATQSPGALDIPNNGKDEDNFFGDFSFDPKHTTPALFVNDGSFAPKKNVVFIVLESCRGDVVGKTVNSKEVAPNINRLAREGTSLPYAYTHLPYTMQSLISMFTGQLQKQQIGDSLFSFLKQHGVQSSVFSGQDETFGEIAEYSQMQSSTATFFDALSAPEDRATFRAVPGSIRLPEQRVLKEVLTHIEQADWQQPQFMYVNFQAAHFPYNYPGIKNLLDVNLLERDQITAENQQDLEKMYWNAVANADDAIGTMIASLRDKGVLDNTVFVITGDHGESLFDDGLLGHGTALTEIQTRIPFVISVPGVSVPQPVGGSDFSRILLALMQADATVDVPQNGAESRGVFQFLGDINSPSQISLVSLGESRTTFDFKKNAAFFSDEERWIPYNEILKDSSFGVRLKALINEWERRRWEFAEQTRAVGT